MTVLEPWHEGDSPGSGKNVSLPGCLADGPGRIHFENRSAAGAVEDPLRYRLHIRSHARKQLELAPIDLQIKLALVLGAAAQHAGQEEPDASSWRTLELDGFRILYDLDTKLRRVTVIYVARGSRQGTAAA